jgi:hypothetical protein
MRGAKCKPRSKARSKPKPKSSAPSQCGACDRYMPAELLSFLSDEHKQLKACRACRENFVQCEEAFCTERNCLCSPVLGNRFCSKHKTIPPLDLTNAFKRPKPGLDDFRMCAACRLQNAQRGASRRKNVAQYKVEFTAEEQLTIQDRGLAIPMLSKDAVIAPTYLLDELWPHEWCLVYPLFCEWVANDGSPPVLVSSYGKAWTQHQNQFVDLLTANKPHALVPRKLTKEGCFPQYLTHRLFRTLLELKAKHNPKFAKGNQPTVEEWILFMKKDKLQSKSLRSESVRAKAVYYIMHKTLKVSSPALATDVINLTGHPGLKFVPECTRTLYEHLHGIMP